MRPISSNEYSLNESLSKMTERFSSRTALLLAGIGMAIGTGNVWRFPRVAARNGGLAFLLLWLLALFLWSIPLLIAEMAIGRRTRKGPIGAFSAFAGTKHTWMGAWVAFVTLAIMCYYSVVAGWCLRYFTYFLTGTLGQGTDANALWQAFSSSAPQTIFFHILAMAITAYIVSRGIQNGVEWANKYLLPALLIMLCGLVVRALTLDGAWEGVRYLLKFDPADLGRAKTWVEAFSQSAWSTGAGWGLMLTFAVYSDEKKSHPATDCTIIGLSNNAASLLAAFVVLPTVFALAGSHSQATEILSKGNEGLTFVSMASLFTKIPLGGLFGCIFFLALFFAALTSFISMVELGTRTLMDFGLKRNRAVIAIAILGVVAGIPSAISRSVFDNQDWVWGVGLLVSGLFVALAVRLHGIDDTATETFPADSVTGIALWKFALTVTVPVAFVALTGWWLFQCASWETGIAWWWPIARYTPGTVLLQWAVVLAILYGLNKTICSWLSRPES